MLPGREKVTLEYLEETGYKSLEELAQALLEEKAQLEELGLKPVFRLHPPRKGYKDIKRPLTRAGPWDIGEKI